jgi:hypothetical protein
MRAICSKSSAEPPASGGGGAARGPGRRVGRRGAAAAAAARSRGRAAAQRTASGGARARGRGHELVHGAGKEVGEAARVLHHRRHQRRVVQLQVIQLDLEPSAAAAACGGRVRSVLAPAADANARKRARASRGSARYGSRRPASLTVPAADAAHLVHVPRLAAGGGRRRRRRHRRGVRRVQVQAAVRRGRPVRLDKVLNLLLLLGVVRPVAATAAASTPAAAAAVAAAAAAVSAAAVTSAAAAGAHPPNVNRRRQTGDNKKSRLSAAPGEQQASAETLAD